jgi:S1-C subfamily serine protease
MSTSEDPSKAPPPRRGRARSVVKRISLRQATRRATLLALTSCVVAAASFVVLIVLLVADGGDSDKSGPRVSEARLEDIVDTLRDSVVDVNVRGPAGRSGGTGWVLDEKEGFIVTNAHVALAGNRISIRRERGKARTAGVVAVAPCEDLALLRVEHSSDLRAIPLGLQTEVRGGQTVVAVGFPRSLARDFRFTTTVGVVSVEKRRVFELPNVIQTDAALNPGNSGGPLVNRSGRLIGVNTLGALFEPLESQGYAIGVDRVRQIVRTLRTGKSLAWGGLGMDFTSPGPTAESVEGILVTHAVPGTPAGKRNLRLPAIMTAINGESLYEAFDREDEQKAEQYCRVVGRDRAEGTIRARLRHVRIDWEIGVAGRPGRPKVYRIPLN